MTRIEKIFANLIISYSPLKIIKLYQIYKHPETEGLEAFLRDNISFKGFFQGLKGMNAKIESFSFSHPEQNGEVQKNMIGEFVK